MHRFLDNKHRNTLSKQNKTSYYACLGISCFEYLKYHCLYFSSYKIPLPRETMLQLLKFYVMNVIWKATRHTASQCQLPICPWAPLLDLLKRYYYYYYYFGSSALILETVWREFISSFLLSHQLFCRPAPTDPVACLSPFSPLSPTVNSALYVACIAGLVCAWIIGARRQGDLLQIPSETSE